MKGLGCGAQEVEVQSQEWLALGEYGGLQFVADSGLGYPLVHFPDPMSRISTRPPLKTKRHGAHCTAMSSGASTRLRLALSLPARPRNIDAWPTWWAISACRSAVSTRSRVGNFDGRCLAVSTFGGRGCGCASHANADITRFLRVVIWLPLRCVREICLRLRFFEYKLQTISSEVDKQIRAVASMQPGTKSVDDTIGQCKGAAEQSSAMKLGASAFGHAASTGGVIERLRWTQPRRTQVAKTCARSDGVNKTRSSATTRTSLSAPTSCVS